MDENEVERRLTQYIALSALGDFLILLGLLFISLGAAAFIGASLGIKGSGEVMVGIFLVAASFIVFLVARSILAGPPEPGKATVKIST